MLTKNQWEWIENVIASLDTTRPLVWAWPGQTVRGWSDATRI